jgi:hypothetical protein
VLALLPARAAAIMSTVRPAGADENVDGSDATFGPAQGAFAGAAQALGRGASARCA